MGYVPKDARWYVADVILELTIGGDRRNVVHVNTHLVEAASPEKAHQKALKLGRESEHAYVNTEGRRVTVKFRGLRDLFVIHDELEHGAEILWQEYIALPEPKLRRWISRKKELAVFAPRRLGRGTPNYMPLTVARKLEAAGLSRAVAEGRSLGPRRRPSERKIRRAKRPPTRTART